MLATNRKMEKGHIFLGLESQQEPILVVVLIVTSYEYSGGRELSLVVASRVQTLRRLQYYEFNSFWWMNQ